jgi:hypothetical protein
MLVSSAIIQDIDAMRKAGLASLAIFYFDSTDDQKRDLRGLLSSLLVQLCHQSDSYYHILLDFYKRHSNDVQLPRDDEVIECLTGLLIVSEQVPVYLILDAPDECSALIPKFLEALRFKLQFRNLRIRVTSQLDADCQRVLTPLAFRSTTLHDESGHKDDINNYIKFFINADPMMQRWKVDDKEWAIKVLMDHADGR